MLVSRVCLCGLLTLVCNFVVAGQSPEKAKMYGSNDVYEVVLKAAEEGNVLAQSEIGQRNFKKRPPDYENAVKWLQKAAESGDSEAQYLLARCYSNGYGVTEDGNKAFSWATKAVEKGHVNAQTVLGVCYEWGEGVGKDMAEAVRWYRKAAEQGDARAQCNLGVCYEFGQGVGKDNAEAVRWYRKAAEQGDAQGMCKLGTCYLNGQGVEKDNAEAVRWYRKAVEQGNARAQYNLGVCYLNGLGVEKDEAETVKWWLKAAEQGYTESQFLLGRLYEAGQGVNKDDAEAIKWYQRAAAQGHADSQKKCKDNGVPWKVSAADVIKNVDETMLADLKAKAESAKSQTIVFKSLYLGMPIQDAGALLRYYMGQSGAGKAPTIFLQDFSDGRWFREVESGLRVTASADGKVTAIYLPRKAVDKLFDTKDVEVKSFIKTFQGAYDVPDFIYDCSTLTVFSCWESDGKVDGIQPVPFEDGMQGKWTATSKKGYTVTVYDEPRVLNRSGVVYKKETIPCGSILVRKINTAAMD